MPNPIATKTSFRKGHIRSEKTIDKQRNTMKEQYRLGLRIPPVKPKGIKDKYKNRKCEHCEILYIPTSGRQRWCSKCVPTLAHRGIMQRYDLGFSEYEAVLLAKNGNCYICRKRKAKVIDHDHNTGTVRGALCNYCNISLHLVEQPEILQRALEYLKQRK